MAFQKMLWVDSTPIISKSLWTRWASVPKTIITFRDSENQTVATIRKYYNRIAYFAVVHLADGADRGYGVVLVSPHSDGVFYEYTDDWGTHYGFNQGNRTYNGTTWYIAGFREIVSDVTCIPEDCILNDTVYSLGTTSLMNAGLDLVKQIYSVNFIEDYQSQQTYGIDFSNGEEIGKTLKATLGISLFSNVLSLYGTNAAYTKLSDYADSVIGAALTLIGNKKFILIDDVHIYADASQAVLRFAFNVDNTELDTKQIRIAHVDTEQGFKYARGGSVGVPDKFRVQSGWVIITNDGTITSGVSSSIDWLTSFYFGENLHSAISPYTGKSPRASNINIIL